MCFTPKVFKRTTLTLVISFAAFHACAEVSGDTTSLNARFTDMTLADALGEVADATGITITTSQTLDNKILLTYSDITAEKLLKRLLHNHNAMYLRHPHTGKLESVRIFSSSNAKPAVANAQQPASQTQAQQQNGKFYMTIAINGTPINMLVDTGANTLAISQSLANQLGLTIGQSSPVNTAAGKSNGYRTIIDSVNLAGKELQGVQAIVLPNLTENGLIGQNVLVHFKRVTENGLMRFVPLGTENSTASAPLPDVPEQQGHISKPTSPTPFQ